VEKAIKMRSKKATGADDIPGDVLSILGEDSFRLMMQLMNNIYETAESGPRTSLELQ
jgi:hypothetical protein